MNNQNWFPSLFNDFFDNDFWMTTRKNNVTAPAVNVKEDVKAYTMEFAAPGIKKEYCRINLDADGNLLVAIENKLEHKEEDKKEHYLRREFSYSNFQQSYKLPDNVIKEEIAAKVEDGVLTITLPKTTKETVKENQRQIAIS
ncbi:MAG: Hsp20 family protein [Bacteroidales bacterium]|nr:Hsp20 family protein [Bacteroidales bacterium]